MTVFGVAGGKEFKWLEWVYGPRKKSGCGDEAQLDLARGQ